LPPPNLVTDKDRGRHRQAQRRLIIAERGMEKWRGSFPGELDKPASTLYDNDPRWDDMWTTTTSDGE
jgi:hypothetical protein